ncbi:MAG: DUF3450 family protein [Candidatus Polarisedimenticolia bacterium]
MKTTLLEAAFVLGAAGWILLAPGGAFAQDAADDRADVESTRATVGKWVGTQQIIFKERRDWQQARDILLARIDLMKKEIATLEEKIAEVRRTSDDAAGRRAEVAAEADVLRKTTAGLTAAVGQFEGHLRRLHVALPAPVQEKIAPLYQRMPAGGVASKASVAERFQNVLGILNEINRMNGEIALASEIRPLRDGRPSEVRTVYLGLGQAYYLSAGLEAGIGRPGSEGWVWEPAPDLAPRIQEVVDILSNKASPKFVSLPVRIQ